MFDTLINLLCGPTDYKQQILEEDILLDQFHKNSLIEDDESVEDSVYEKRIDATFDDSIDQYLPPPADLVPSLSIGSSCSCIEVVFPKLDDEKHHSDTTNLLKKDKKKNYFGFRKRASKTETKEKKKGFFPRPSKSVQKSNMGELHGDGDIWYEIRCISRSTNRVRSYFVSTWTGERKREEPPTNASKVIYLP